MNYPDNDTEFQDKTIESVAKEGDTYVITCDGWSMWCGKDCPIAPEVGQLARFYGPGIGSQVRGLFINGTKIWYRTKAEQKEHSEIERYGADAADWLSRWDAGKGVWSIEMGGLGPGYEQAIQITIAEVLRHLLATNYDHATWSDPEKWQRDRKAIEEHSFANERIKSLGLSGAQWGAAMQVATALYIKGPRTIMNDEKVKDRHIQVNRVFPGMSA